MPKPKTRKVVAKRIRITKTGKMKQKCVGTSHLRRKENSNQHYRKKREKNVSSSNTNRVRVALPSSFN
ncbi:hypothetical protein COT52_00520 [candidate division WWE3 bacterium CG08_land_8_20_14_0_20_43_13]|uniref:Large ribosomal subunit protein bL35 n=1 Tax=candidate division WWE3 bacterium CG08_land_8_20_14_0_20_43_13 TaxID=1975087 RepID=A0A2H0XAI6_UNCKA|nr:MAG: hypothetical protein COT52_00520 [candidate division WWE3 bacterium CG08_land_8_20_14_0_20_43_13]